MKVLGMAVVALLCGTMTSRAGAQESPPTPQYGGRFSGVVASTRTTQPVSVADIRLIYVDSMKGVATASAGLGEVFVDSSRSRAGITDETGHFSFNRLAPGHYLMQVRRIGFTPFEGVVTIDTAAVEMELALEQMVPVLPRVTITASAVDKVAEKLDRTGFVSRSRMGTSGTYIMRSDVLKHHDQYVQDLLARYGVRSDAEITIDRMPADWDVLRHYPADLVIGIEIYRRRGSLPTEFNMTQRGGTAFDEGRAMGGNAGGTGGIARWSVIIWTYIP